MKPSRSFDQELSEMEAHVAKMLENLEGEVANPREEERRRVPDSEPRSDGARQPKAGQRKKVAGRTKRTVRRDPLDGGNRRPTSRLERFIQNIRDDGWRLPLSQKEFEEAEKTYGHMYQHETAELCRRGVVKLSDAWDGSLPPSIIWALDARGLGNRADFRAKYLAGEIDLRNWRNCGKLNQAKILAWAGLPVPDDGKWEAKLNLPVQTWKDMDALAKSRGLAGRDELVEQLVMEAQARSLA